LNQFPFKVRGVEFIDLNQPVIPPGAMGRICFCRLPRIHQEKGYSNENLGSQEGEGMECKYELFR
jgi:hypothetical protein